jgi:hypothetical protein
MSTTPHWFFGYSSDSKNVFREPDKKKTEKASFLSVSLLMCIVHDAFKYFGELAKTPQWCILCANVILGHIHGE